MNKLENKFPLGFFPTPIEFLPGFSKKYGANVFIKRDDQTGLATGGNKTRKLEYLIKDALDKNADCVITIGGPQSNHCRQTAAAAVKAGLKCYLIVRGKKPEIMQGNLLLNNLLGAEIRFAGDNNLFNEISALAEKLKAQGKRPYKITMGGSDKIGVFGYVSAMQELQEQIKALNSKFDEIYLSTSSGGTQAGMMLGAELFGIESKIIGIANDKGNVNGLYLEKYIAKIISEAQKELGLEPNLADKPVNINRDYNKAGYGVLTKNEVFAIKELAQTDGIFLDTVYSGRAFYGLIDILRKQKTKPDENILFWHTGGQAANFAYAEELA